ncbi:MAG: secretin N-terminal domain-containing protein [Verrucomicrobiales bacterium]
MTSSRFPNLPPPPRWLALAHGLALALITPLAAQDPAPPPPPAVTPAADPGEDGIQLQFPNNGINDVLGIYELLTGKAVIKDSEIFDGQPLSLVTSRPVTQEEAIELIESALYLNGYVLSQSLDGRSVRVARGTATQASLTRGLEVAQSIQQLPPGNSIASYFLRLQHLDPSEAATTLWSHLGLNRFGRLTPVTSPPGLLITENAENIRQILRVAAVLDVPQGQTGLITEFYTLVHADAVVVGQILASTFTQRQSLPTLTRETIGDNETRVPARVPSTVIPKVVADDRLNRIMLVAQPIDQKYARTLIQEFDQPIATLAPLERRLRYVFVDQILPVLVDILQDTGSGTTTLAGGEIVRSKRPPQASSDPATLAGRARRRPLQREGVTTTPDGYEDQLTPPEDNVAPLSVLVGKTRLVADVQANKLIAYGPPGDIAKITSLLSHLDQKPPQVYLATIIGQLSLDNGWEVGFDYLREFQAGGEGNYAGAIVTRESLLRAIQDIRNPGMIEPPLPGLQGLNVYGEIADGVNAFVRALEQTQRFKVLSRPSIYAANNKKAVITSGRRIPVPTSTVTDLEDTNSVRTNIEFQDVVLKLEVIPLINSNKEVSLTIAQINDTVVGQQVVAENTVPIIGTERLVTSVTIPNRSTIVLGGLITENEEKTVTGVPMISHIPVLGHLFKSTKLAKNRKELIIFIQPVVVEDTEEAAAASFEEDMRTGIGGEAAALFPEAGAVPDPGSLEDPQASHLPTRHALPVDDTPSETEITEAAPQPTVSAAKPHPRPTRPAVSAPTRPAAR